jgi:tRNA pseudouridine38-40 synthase
VPALCGRGCCHEARISSGRRLKKKDPTPTFKISLAYDGTGFVGWQRQRAGISIQGLLERALGELDERDVTVTGAGRTDAGVHALGQVASFRLERRISAEGVARAMNARLPAAVRVIEAAEVEPTFHARFAARAKTYRFRIWNGDVVSPFESAYVWHVPAPLDLDAMRTAARVLEGRHDFTAFQAAGSATKSAEREVVRSRLVEGSPVRRDLPCEDGEQHHAALVAYEITANGFLRHMVRAIAGSLVEVGRGRRDAAWLSRVLASRERAWAGPTAPASGLFLVRVHYGPNALADEP